MKKNLTAIIICGLVLTAAAGCILTTKKEPTETIEHQIQQKEEKAETKSEPVKTQPQQVKIKSDLYSSTIYDLPLLSVMEISKVSPVVKKSIDSTLEASQGFYLLKRKDDKVIAILQNPIETNQTFSRHNLQFAEINNDGKVIYHTAGYPGINGETVNSIKQTEDSWLFDETVEPYRPIRHVAYDEKGKVKFTEDWNYDSLEPVKYEMKDSSGKVISIMKETSFDDNGYTRDHIFYDNSGNTIMQVSASYEGANISKFTYFNSDDKENSLTILSEYSDDGNKIKEKIYNTEYALTNTVTTDYSENERKNVTLWDSEGKKTEEISS